MAKNILEYRCLLISPNDVDKERKALEEVVQNWNAHIGNSLNARVELVSWQKHSVPELGDSPQKILNKQLLDNCDLGVAIFWSRLGTPTDKYASGSVEEIYELFKKGCPVVVYFNKQDIPQANLIDDQYKNLTKIKEELLKKSVLAFYNDINNLREQFLLHLTSQISKLISRDKNYGDSKDEKLTAPKPDIRVSVSDCIVFHPRFDTIYCLRIDIQNYSPITVFVGNVYLMQKSSDMLFIFEDYVTKSKTLKDKIEPGEGISFNIDPKILINYRDKLKCAIFKDKIGRIYESDPKEFEEKVSVVIEQYRANGENKVFDKK